jgi:hypothetical protein
MSKRPAPGCLINSGLAHRSWLMHDGWRSCATYAIARQIPIAREYSLIVSLSTGMGNCRVVLQQFSSCYNYFKLRRFSLIVPNGNCHDQ